MKNPELNEAAVQQKFQSLVEPVPADYSLAWWICGRHAGQDSRPAMVVPDGPGGRMVYTFQDIWQSSELVAGFLESVGVTQGTRVAIAGPQGMEAAVAHIATYRLGGIAVPLSPLFGADAFAFRLAHSGAAVLLLWAPLIDRLEETLREIDSLLTIVVWGEGPSSLPDGVLTWEEVLSRSSGTTTLAVLTGESPCMIVYTSGTSGRPKGVLHAQRVVWGHLPAICLAQNVDREASAILWTPADWAWLGGLVDVLLSAWHMGFPVVVQRVGPFDPEETFALLAREDITNAFIPPTALRLMSQLPPARHPAPLALKGVMTGGEALGEDMLHWARETFGAPVHEVYGQTEMSCVLGNASAEFPSQPGSVGMPYPGAKVRVIDSNGHSVPPGEVGEIAVHRDNPVMFLNYWNDEKETAQKFLGDWALSGDLCRRDPQGYFWIIGRSDDIIITSGYRVSPTEIEECIIKHPEVAAVAVVGIPDQTRGQIIKAYIQLRTDKQPGPSLADSIRALVKDRLAKYEYPRQIEFIKELPRTETGKIRRIQLRETGSRE